MSRGLTLLCFILLFFINTNGQSNKFVIDSAMWVISWNDVGTVYIDDYYGYYIQGDTTINSTSYKIVNRVSFLNQSPNWPIVLTVNTWIPIGAIREDSNIVYFIPFIQILSCNISAEYEIYNFNMQVNDSITNCTDVNYPIPYVVTSIDSSVSPITYYLDNGMSISQYLGGYNGPFEGLIPPVSGYLTYIQNYCIGNIYQCATLTGNSDYEAQRSIRIFPNPAGDYINISGLQPNDQISFYTLLGVELTSINYLSNDNLSVDIGKFPMTLIVKIASNNSQNIFKLIHHQN